MIMRFIAPILIVINISCFAQDTLLIFSHQYLIEKELNCCRDAKNQLNCIDSLIQVNLNVTSYSRKLDQKNTYFDRLRKLSIYHFNAGIISGLRGDLEQSFVYFNKMGSYFDTLAQNGKGDEIKDLKRIAYIKQTEFCTKTYFKDTALFNRCNCMRFFPKYKDESVIISTTSPSKVNQKSIVKYPSWGEFYINDTLRINKHFVSDSASIIYFNKVLRPLIQTKLLRNPYFFEMLGESSMNIKRDTIIYKFNAKYEKGKHERKWELVFSISQNPEKYYPILFVLSNLELPGYIKNLEIFIPIVLTTENSNNANYVNVYDDHFLMEIRKIPKIEPK